MWSSEALDVRLVGDLTSAVDLEVALVHPERSSILTNGSLQS